jgi:hypothetical protein
MRFPYLDWPRKWRRGAIDGEVVFGRLRREVARGGRNFGEGGPGVGLDQVGGLGEEVREWCAAGILAGWSDCCEFRRGARVGFGGARRKKGKNRPGKGFGSVL